VVGVYCLKGEVSLNEFFFLSFSNSFMRAFYLDVHLILQIAAFIINLIGFAVVFYTKVHFFLFFCNCLLITLHFP